MTYNMEQAVSLLGPEEAGHAWCSSSNTGRYNQCGYCQVTAYMMAFAFTMTPSLIGLGMNEGEWQAKSGKGRRNGGGMGGGWRGLALWGGGA